MAHETELTEAGVIWTFHGNVTFDELMAANSEVWDREEWDETIFEVVDGP